MWLAYSTVRINQLWKTTCITACEKAVYRDHTVLVIHSFQKFLCERCIHVVRVTLCLRQVFAQQPVCRVPIHQHDSRNSAHSGHEIADSHTSTSLVPRPSQKRILRVWARDYSYFPVSASAGRSRRRANVMSWEFPADHPGNYPRRHESSYGPTLVLVPRDYPGPW